MSSKNMIQSALCHTTRPTPRTNNTTSSSSMHMINLYAGNMTTQKKACKNQVLLKALQKHPSTSPMTALIHSKPNHQVT